MKYKKCLQPVISIVLLSAIFTACDKPNGPDGYLQGKPGHYVFTGSNKSSLDSQYVADTATHHTARLVIDSSFVDVVDVMVDKQNISFSFRYGTFTERMLGYLTYSFPINGPYSYAANAINGTFYTFTLSGEDSLYFDYRHTTAGSYFLYKKLEFKGRRIQ